MGALQRNGGFRLQPPQQHIRLVQRPALLSALDDALQCRLVLLLAPAGYGKTTLLTQWRDGLHRAGQIAAWLTLDEQSSGAPELLVAIIEALGGAGVNLGELAPSPVKMLDLLGPARTFDMLIFELDRVDAAVVLIIDDYHFAQSVETDELLDQFIRRARDSVHLVIASRVRPGLMLPVLRARGQVAEIGVSQLRFSLEDARELFGSEVSDADVGALYAEAEGWAIALQLARLWMQDNGDAAALLRSFSGSSDDIAHYLTQQVFAGLAPELQVFLLETSIFDQFDADLADAARGASDSAGFMASLKRLNGLVVPIEPPGAGVRYHRLVADFLAQRRDQLGALRLGALHRASSAWFGNRGETYAAVRHAVAAGDRGGAIALIERANCMRLCLDGSVRQVTALFSLLDATGASARLQLASAMILLKQGKLDAADREFEGARRRAATVRNQTDRDGFTRDELIFVAMRAGYRDSGLSPADHGALDQLGTAMVDGDQFLRGLLNNILCVIHLRMGNLAEAASYADTALRLYRSIGFPYGCIFVHIHLGTMALAQGRHADNLQSLGAARKLILDHFCGDASLGAMANLLLAESGHQQALVTAETAAFEANLAVVVASEGWPQIFVIGFGTAADRAFTAGGLSAAEPVVDRGLDLARANRLWQVEAFLLARHACLLVRAGHFEAAQQRIFQITTGGSGNAPLLWAAADELAIARARLLLAQGHADQCVPILTELIGDSEAGGRLQSVMRAQVLAAMALHRLGRAEDATTVLLRVLDRARVDDCRQMFIDEGAPMAALLRETMKRRGAAQIGGALRDFTTDLLAAFLTSGGPDETRTSLSALTPREREILRALVQGGSNKVIARAVDLNENAVKFHLKSVFRKLGVSDRAMAVVVAAKLDHLH